MAFGLDRRRGAFLRSCPGFASSARGREARDPPPRAPGIDPAASRRRVADPPGHRRLRVCKPRFSVRLGTKDAPLTRKNILPSASQAYWRIAGMSYLKYSNMCGEVVRASLKEPFFSQAKAREAVYMKASEFVGGKAQAPVITEVIPPSAGK